MASGFDARVAFAKETTFGTRVAPARFLPLTAEDMGYNINREFAPVLGLGMNARPSQITNKVGTGSISGPLTTTGLGFLLDFLHPNTVTPTQVAATPAYLQTHTINGAPSKSASAQVQMPPVTSATLVPHDMTGIMFGGITFNIASGGLATFEMPLVYQNLDLAQTLVSYVAPASYSIYSFQNATLTIGGVAETNVLGDVSLSMNFPLRDDAFALGTGGLIAKPVPTDKPTYEGTFTADFNDNTNISRTLNNTMADVILTFTGATISGANNYFLKVTIPDCVFTTQRPGVGSAGPVQLSVAFTAASPTGNNPSIQYQSTDTTL